MSLIDQANDRDYTPNYPTEPEQVNVYLLEMPLTVPDASESLKIVPQSDEVPETTMDSPEPITFRVTAYCACEKCCGKWARNRPVDENGEPIVIGAGGVELEHGVSVASPLPFHTQIDLEGIGVVVVHDRTANWIVEKHGEHIVDLYMADHQAAWDFGVQYLEGVIL